MNSIYSLKSSYCDTMKYGSQCSGMKYGSQCSGN